MSGGTMLMSRPSLLLPSFLLLLTIHPTDAAGGLNIFQLHTDMFALAISLTILVVVTIVFEVVLHSLKHMYQEDIIVTEIIQKVNAELTVLGFISIATILVVQNTGTDPTIVEFLGEFEIAHVWLFFIGLMFVVEACLYITYARNQTRNLFAFERADNNKMAIHLSDQNESCLRKMVRFCPLTFTCKSWTCCNSRNFNTASHKLHRILFKHFYKNEIKRHLKSYYKEFDFGQYLYAFIRHEIIGLQEITISSWIFFLLVFWIMTGVRLTSTYIKETATSMTTIYLNWICVLLFLCLLFEGFYSHYKIHQFLATVITGEENKHISEAVTYLTELSSDSITWDNDAQSWNNPKEYRNEQQLIEMLHQKKKSMENNDEEQDGESGGESGESGDHAAVDVTAVDVTAVNVTAPIGTATTGTGTATATTTTATTTGSATAKDIHFEDKVWDEDEAKIEWNQNKNRFITHLKKQLNENSNCLSVADINDIIKIEKIKDVLRLNVYNRLEDS
jgi:hypothetical protein